MTKRGIANFVGLFLALENNAVLIEINSQVDGTSQTHLACRVNVTS